MQNWLDKVIAWVSPEAGRKRVVARKMTEIALAYDGVRSARRQGGWNTTNASGNVEIGQGMVKLRANARDLCRNNAYARKAKREWAKRVVGYGIKPRPSTGTKRVNDVILDYWNRWAEQCCSDRRLNFYAAQKLIVSSCYESGEVLVRLYDRRPEDNLPVPMQIQVLESDFLDEARTQKLENGYIIQGVEFDPLGRIRGYWLFAGHPGDVVATSLKGLRASKLVPAESVLHHMELDRPGDARSVTRFAAVIAKLRDLDEYADAEIMRKKTEACLAMMVTQTEGSEGPTLAAAAVDASTGLKLESMRPGMIGYTTPGTEVKFFSPEVSGDYGAYKKTELREVAAGLEIPYVVLDDNLEAVNYSSYRGGLLAFRDAIEEYRWNWLVPQVLDPIYRRFIDRLFVMGAIKAKDYAVQWDPPPFDLLDREQEAKADRLELQLGKKTWPQFVGEQGSDAEVQIAEITKWKPRLEEAGVTFASSTSNVQQPAPEDGGVDSKKKNKGGEDADPDAEEE